MHVQAHKRYKAQGMPEIYVNICSHTFAGPPSNSRNALLSLWYRAYTVTQRPLDSCSDNATVCWIARLFAPAGPLDPPLWSCSTLCTLPQHAQRGSPAGHKAAQRRAPPPCPSLPLAAGPRQSTQTWRGSCCRQPPGSTATRSWSCHTMRSYASAASASGAHTHA
jgi:hypothetical protein